MEQGWPKPLLQLVRSFLTDRRVRVRLEDSTTGVYKVACGTPQGSPLSPILYMLYLAELLNKDKTLRFGYADDLCLFRVSHSLERNVELLAVDAKEVLDYGLTNKLFFDKKKCEMIHFARARTATNPDLVIPGHYTVSPIVTSEKKGRHPALRWLGVYFDKKLCYKRHVEERNEKAFHVARHIRSLARVKDGPPALSLRKVVITCVVSSLLYGMEVWYAGRTRVAGFRRDNSPKVVSTRLGGHLKLLESTLVMAIRGVLPVWRTTPLATLFRDSGIPSPQVALEEALARLALRLQTTDSSNPLVRRTAGVWEQARPLTKLQVAGRLLPQVPRPILRPPHFSPGCRTDPTKGLSKEQAAEAFKQWWKDLPPSDITIFSDGSEQYKLGVRGVGYGFAVYQNTKKLFDGYGSIHKMSHVFDAEAIGAWEGLHRTLCSRSLSNNRIWMCIDSTSVIWCLRGNASTSSQWAFHKCQDAMQARDIKIKWSPGHMGIEGNEEADALADYAATPGEPRVSGNLLSQQPTVCGLRSEAEKLKHSAAATWWDAHQHKLSKRYTRWSLRYSTRPPRELELPRATLHKLLALRTGHGDFEWYHKKFNHLDAVLTCNCGCPKTPEHLVHCRWIRHTFKDWPDKPDSLPKDYAQGFSYMQTLTAKPSNFALFLKITGFYSDLCV
jgi:ribonuclease HI